MSSDCKECLKMAQENKKRKSLNQMSEAERDLYWESYKNLIGDNNESEKSAQE